MSLPPQRSKVPPWAKVDSSSSCMNLLPTDRPEPPVSSNPKDNSKLLEKAEKIK